MSDKPKFIGELVYPEKISPSISDSTITLLSNMIPELGNKFVERGVIYLSKFFKSKEPGKSIEALKGILELLNLPSAKPFSSKNSAILLQRLGNWFIPSSASSSSSSFFSSSYSIKEKIIKVLHKKHLLSDNRHNKRDANYFLLAGCSIALYVALSCLLAFVFQDKIEISVSTRYSNNTYSTVAAQDQPAETIKYKIPFITQKMRFSRLDLVLVLDVSGSMHGLGKLNFEKEGVYEVLKMMRPMDRLSVVVFGDLSKTLFPLTQMTEENKMKCRDMVENMETQCYTDIYAGLKEGIEEFINNRKKRNGAGIDSHTGATDGDGDIADLVIVLSDGGHNHGGYSEADIIKLAGSQKKNGMTVSSIGLGSDCDKDLMHAIADNGGGSYYFVANSSELPGIFTKEVSRMRDIFTQDQAIILTGGPDGPRTGVVTYAYENSEANNTNADANSSTNTNESTNANADTNRNASTNSSTNTSEEEEDVVIKVGKAFPWSGRQTVLVNTMIPADADASILAEKLKDENIFFLSGLPRMEMKKNTTIGIETVTKAGTRGGSEPWTRVWTVMIMSIEYGVLENGRLEQKCIVVRVTRTAGRADEDENNNGQWRKSMEVGIHDDNAQAVAVCRDAARQLTTGTVGAGTYSRVMNITEGKLQPFVYAMEEKLRKLSGEAKTKPMLQRADRQAVLRRLAALEEHIARFGRIIDMLETDAMQGVRLDLEALGEYPEEKHKHQQQNNKDRDGAGDGKSEDQWQKVEVTRSSTFHEVKMGENRIMFS